MCASIIWRERARFHDRPRADRIEYPEGEGRSVAMHDGSVIRFHKLASDHDWRDRTAAMAALEKHRADGAIVTGLIYLNDEAGDLHARLNTVKGR